MKKLGAAWRLLLSLSAQCWPQNLETARQPPSLLAKVRRSQRCNEAVNGVPHNSASPSATSTSVPGNDT